jgi:hypothetical protein
MDKLGQGTYDTQCSQFYPLDGAAFCRAEMLDRAWSGQVDDGVFAAFTIPPSGAEPP